MLENMQVLAYLYVGFPISATIALGWTSIQIRRTVVEVHIRKDGVAIRSLIAAAEPREPLSWFRLLDAQIRDNRTHITVGYDMFTLNAADWPNYVQLQSRLSGLLENTRGASPE